MESNIKVSILIPLYNTEEYIEKCICSIPDRSDIEIVVVDDCSTDDSYSKVKSLLEKRSQPYQLLKNKENKGVGYTRNILIDNCCGKYIFFLDSDDYIIIDNFIYVLDNILKNQVCLKCAHKNKIKEFYSRVHRGDFLNRDFVLDTKFQDRRCHEDFFFALELKRKPNYREYLCNIVIYFYNEPREGSLTWFDRKSKGDPDYQKDENYCIERQILKWKKN